jgi:hypothetical protein
MTVTVLSSDGAHEHQSPGRSQGEDDVEPARPLLQPQRQGGGVRILRTPEELSEAINRAQEFERRQAGAMRTRSERYKNALGVVEHTAVQLTLEMERPSDDQ